VRILYQGQEVKKAPNDQKPNDKKPDSNPQDPQK